MCIRDRGDRVGIVGANGAGKTTLLNILAGELSADGGQFFVSQNVTIGYLKQKNYFDSQSTVLEEVRKIFKPIEDMEKEMTCLLYTSLGHLDVVPEGEGWRLDPYSGTVEDGYIYGRGTLDDKGPMVAALFAMKALKDSGYVPARRIRMILGLSLIHIYP